MFKKHNQILLFVICFILMPTFASISIAETFVRFNLICSAPANKKASAYSDNLWGIATANGMSLFREYYSSNNKQPAYISLTGKFKDGELTLRGKGYWNKKSGSYPFYFSVKSPSMLRALESELKGREGQDGWRRDCIIKKTGDQFTVSQIAGSKRKLESLQSRLEGSLKKQDASNSQYEKLKIEFENLKEVKNADLSNITELRSALSSKEKEFETQQSAYLEKTESLKSQIKKLKKKQNSSNSTAKLNEKLILLGSEKSRLTEALTTLRSQLVDAQSVSTQFEQLETENKQLLSSLNKTTQEKTILEKEFEAMQSQLLNLTDGLSKSSQQSSTANLGLEKIENENRSLKQQLVQLSSAKTLELQSLTQQCSTQEKADSELISKLVTQNEEITQKCSVDIESGSNQHEGSFIASLMTGAGNVFYSAKDAVVSNISSAFNGLVNVIIRTINVPLSLF